MAKSESGARLEIPERSITDIRCRTMTVHTHGRNSLKMTIPEHGAEHHGIEEGDEVAVQIEDDGILVRPIEEVDPLNDD